MSEPGSHLGIGEVVARFAAGSSDPDVLRQLRKGFEVYVRSGWAVPLERCLSLPNTPRRAKRAQRDYWLIKAARDLGGASPWSVSVALAAEMDAFLSRGPWSYWRGLGAPPDGSSELRQALFHAASANDGKSLTARQISRIIERSDIFL